ncbi:hypothetical protein [Streptomyces sp. NPDC088789]|uniref:hypothetical protein n=1 Tax=Streptomyces sp. NPDC088789 TaxID=3365899 RepID=UPI00380214AF
MGAAAVARALAGAGRGRQAEALLRSAAARHPWAAAEGLAALARHHAAADPERAANAPEHTPDGPEHATDAPEHTADGPEHAAHLMREAESVARRSSREAGDPDQDIQFAVLATALADLGHSDDAERLADAVGTPSVRAWALAGLAMACAEAEDPDALRLACAAAEIIENLTDTPFLDDARVAVAQALGCVGAAERAMRLAHTRDHPWSRAGQAHDEALMAAAMGLWAYEPAAATAIVDTVEGRFVRGDAGLEGPVVGYAGLMVAVGHLYPERGRRLAQYAHRAAWRKRALGTGAPDSRYHQGGRPQDALVMSVLTAAADPGGAEEWLAQAETLLEAGSSTRWGVACLAFVHAALGDRQTALNTMSQGGVDGWTRAEVFTELAAYVTDVRSTPVFGGTVGASAELSLLRRLASLLIPADNRPVDIAGEGRTHDPAARREFALYLLMDALTHHSWHLTAPVFADLAPEVVLSMRDVVFEHLGLDD